MSKRTVLISIAAVVIVLSLVVTVFPIYLVAEKSTAGTSGFQLYKGASSAQMHTFSKVGIVTSPCRWSLRHMQARVAENLRDDLTKEKISCSVTRGAKSYTSSCPTVAIYHSEAEAVKNKADFIIYIKPRTWDHLPVSALIQKWKTVVEVTGGLPGFADEKAFESLNGSWGRGPVLAYKCNIDAEASGTTTGIFGTRTLTNRVAARIADRVAKDMSNTIREQVESHRRGTDGPPSHLPSGNKALNTDQAEQFIHKETAAARKNAENMLRNKRKP